MITRVARLCIEQCTKKAKNRTFITRPKCHYHDYGPGEAAQEPLHLSRWWRQEWSDGGGFALCLKALR